MAIKYSQEQIDIAEKHGFSIDEKTSLLRREDEGSSYAEEQFLIIRDDFELFKIESYGTYPDGDGGYDHEYLKEYSKPGQSLEDFLKDY